MTDILPWPGFFELVASVDLYVHLDAALFSRGGFINRVQIEHPAGGKWMTIPLQGKGSFQRICDLTAAGNDWKREHRESVFHSLAHSPYPAEALDLVESVYSIDSLPELLIYSIEKPKAKMGLSGPRE